MSVAYRLAYRFGVMPWDAKDPGSLRQLTAMFDREQDGREPPLGRAVDLGCGTGQQSVDLARRGWAVTGVDAVPRALDRAREHARLAGVEVDFRRGDVTRLSEAVGTGYRLALDLGCFHGLEDSQRVAYGEQLTMVTEPGASLLLFAFSPGRRGPLPRGVDRAGVRAAFAGWRITDDQAVDKTSLSGPAAKAAPRWYRLVRG